MKVANEARLGKYFKPAFALAALVFLPLVVWRPAGGGITEPKSTTAQLQASAQDDQGCSNASLTGSYGAQINGTIPGVFAIGGIARIIYDGQGGFTQIDNVQIIASGQPPVVILDRPGTGTYTVSPDCTGSETLNAGGQVFHIRLVVVNHGNQVFDMGSDPGVVLTGVSKKQ